MTTQSNKLTFDILNGPILPLLLRLASPNVIAFLLQSSVSIAEVWYVGQLGTRSLAALAMVFPMFMLMTMMSAGALGGAVASSVARSIGRGAIERGQALIWHALIIALTGASIFSAVYFSLDDVILKALGGRGDVLLQAKTYAVVLFSGCALIWIANVLSSVYRGMGNMKYPAVLMVLAVVIQIPLSGSLILGWGPFPSMGIAGAAVSAILSTLITTTLLLLPLIFGNPLVKLRIHSLRLEIALFQRYPESGIAGIVITNPQRFYDIVHHQPRQSLWSCRSGGIRHQGTVGVSADTPDIRNRRGPHLHGRREYGSRQTDARRSDRLDRRRHCRPALGFYRNGGGRISFVVGWFIH